MSKRVQFNDLSTPGDDGPITAWSWTFGDGGSSTDQNPVHEYLASGSYDVTLTVTGTGDDGTDNVTHNLTIVVPVPVADFSFIATGLSVAFTDLSEAGESGPITDWSWDFGDGQTGGGGSGGGEFPTAGILDNFDSSAYNAAGGLAGVGNWLGPLGAWGTTVRHGDNALHTINPTNGASSAYLSPNYGPDVEAYASIVTLDTVNPTNYMRIACRIQNPTSSTTRSQYQVNVLANGTWKLERVTNNTTNLLATFTQTVVNGDKFGISVIGQVLTAWWYDSAGDHAWHVVGTHTDESTDKITVAGKIGLLLQGTAGEKMMTLDNVGGGTAVAGSDSSPTHVYAAAGSYDVKLTVTGTGSDGTDDVTKNIVVRSGTALTAIFTSSVSGATASFSNQSIAGPSGPITAYDWNFGDGSAHGNTANPTHTYAVSGTYTVRLTVTGTGGDGTNYVEHSVTVTVTPPSGGTIFEQFIDATDFARPAFTPTRTVRFKDKAGLDAAVADLRAGDLVIYDPASFGLAKTSLTISSNYQIHDKKLSGRAVFDFGCSHNVWDNSKIVPDFVAFRDTRVGWEAFTFRDCTNITILGGDYQASHSAGSFRVMGDMTDCKALDIYCHDSGGSGVLVQPTDSATGAAKTMDNIVIRSETNRYSMDPSYDNHNDKGTGFHGLINHGDAGTIKNSYFYTYAHDPLRPGESAPDKNGVTRVWPEGGGGSACEPGTSKKAGLAFASQDNNHYWTYGENLLMRVTTNINNSAITNPGTIVGGQTGGNIINFWGPTPLNGEVHHFVGGKNCTGAMCHGDNSTWDTANPQIRVLVGRSENMNQYTPSGGTEKYTSGHNIDYVDCT